MFQVSKWFDKFSQIWCFTVANLKNFHVALLFAQDGIAFIHFSQVFATLYIHGFFAFVVTIENCGCCRCFHHQNRWENEKNNLSVHFVSIESSWMKRAGPITLNEDLRLANRLDIRSAYKSNLMPILNYHRMSTGAYYFDESKYIHKSNKSFYFTWHKALFFC